MGGGALKAMNDAIKQNRELLKANKKKPFENGSAYKVTESLLINEPKLSEEDRIKIAQATWQEEHASMRKKLILLAIISLCIGTGVALFLFG